MVGGHTHLQRVTTVAQVFSSQDRTLLTDEQSRREGVAADVVRADGQIRHLEVLDAMDVETLIQNTMLDDAVALARCHGAGAEGVPGSLAMALNPFLDVFDILMVTRQ